MQGLKFAQLFNRLSLLPECLNHPSNLSEGSSISLCWGTPQAGPSWPSLVEEYVPATDKTRAQFSDGAPWRCGVGGQREARPCPLTSSRVANSHATKDLIFSVLHLCWFRAGPYDAAATHPYPSGAELPLRLSLLRPNQARVAWRLQAPGWLARAPLDAPGGRLR